MKQLKTILEKSDVGALAIEQQHHQQQQQPKMGMTRSMTAFVGSIHHRQLETILIIWGGVCALFTIEQPNQQRQQQRQQQIQQRQRRRQQQRQQHPNHQRQCVGSRLKM